MARVFISHASADLALAVNIRTWLRDAGHDVFLDRDLAEGIQVGEEWKRRLYRELRGADAIVCVVTDAYRASEWCSAEVGIADVLGCPLLPVRAAAGAASALFDGLQYADVHADADRARIELTRRLELVDTAGGTAWPDGRSPYPGLRPFEADMARVFRGRSVETRRLVRHLRSLGERAGGGLVVVVGPSGCGKSSLVRAGLVPALAADPGWEVAAPFTPGTDPVAALARALAVTGQRVGIGWTPATTAARLAAGDGNDHGDDGLAALADELLIHGRRKPRERLLLVIDQGEELLTRAGPDARARFARVVSACLAGPVRAVVTLRSEFLDRLRALPELAAVDVEPFALRPLDAAMLRTIVKEPATVAGLHIDAELVDRLVADTPSGEALPLLAFSLAELAQGKARGDELSAHAYADMGGVPGALARQADEALAKAVAASGLPPELVLDGLTRLATLDDTGQPTRRHLPATGAEPARQAALAVFVEHHLLVTTKEAGGARIGVAHEALLTAWPPLAEAVEARGSALREIRTIENAAAEWKGADRSPAYLWDAARLTAASVALDLGGPVDDLAGHPDLDPPATAFLAASTAQARARRAHTRRRRAGTVTTLSVLLVLSIVLGGLASAQAGREQQRATEVERVLLAQDLVAGADSARPYDRTLALRLGLAAHAVSPDTAAAEASLVETLGTPHPIGPPVVGHEGGVNAVAFSPDGRRLASGADDERVAVWDVTDSAAPRPLPWPPGGHHARVTAVAFSRDGSLLASGARDGGVRLWQLADAPRGEPVLAGELTASHGPVRSLAFSADGTTLAVVAQDGLALWQIDRATATAQVVAEQVVAEAGEPLAVAFASNRPVLAAAFADGTVRLVDAAGGAALGAPIAGGPDLRSVAFTPDGHLAVGSGRSLRLWDVDDPEEAQPVGAPVAGDFTTLSLSRDGHTLLAGARTGSARLVDLTDAAHPRPLGAAISDRADDDVRSVALSPDGTTLAAGLDAGFVQMWDVADPRRPRFSAGLAGDATVATGQPRGVTFVDDRTVLISDRDGLRRWRVGEPAPEPLSLPPGAPQCPEPGPITFSRRAHVVAAGCAPGGAAGQNATVRLWDPTERTGRGTIDDPLLGTLAPLVLSPDGRTLVTGTTSGVQLWDVDSFGSAHPLDSLPDPAVYVEGTTTATFSADSRTLAIVSSALADTDRVALWSLADREQPRRLGTVDANDPAEQIDAVAFSPDGTTLAVSTHVGAYPSLSLWDLTDPERPGSLGRLGDPLTGDPGRPFGSLAFSPDGRMLAAGSRSDDPAVDGAVGLWDVADPREPRRLSAPLTGNGGSVTALDFSPDGRALAVASAGRPGPGGASVVRIWEVGDLVDLRRDLVHDACARAGGFGEAEWHRVVPGVAFPAPCGRS